MAARYLPWRQLAHELGFVDAKIDVPWTFSDAGRHIKYMENPYFIGAIIGDGNYSSDRGIRFYNEDQEIWDYIDSIGKDYTIFALIDGIVKYEPYSNDRRKVSVYAE